MNIIIKVVFLLLFSANIIVGENTNRNIDCLLTFLPEPIDFACLLGT